MPLQTEDFQKRSTRTLSELAELLNAQVVGDGSYPIVRVSHPKHIQSENDLVLAIEPSVIPFIVHTNAKAAIFPEGVTLPENLNLMGYLVVPRPRVALAKLLDIFNLPAYREAGIHPSAVVHKSAVIASGVSIGPFVSVGPQAKIGKNTVLLPHVSVGAEAQLGESCILYAGARVGDRVVLGNHVILQHNASIGADGFSYVTPEAGSIESARTSGGKIEAENQEIIRINSIGTVILEDSVEIGACSCVDRSTLGATVIKRGTKIDNLVMVGHNNTIGENCLIVSQVGIAGSCKIGDRVVLAGQVGIIDHITIGDDTIVTAQSGVIKNIPGKTIVGGSPAIPRRELLENLANVNKIKKLREEVKALKAQLADITTQLDTLSEKPLLPTS